MLKKNKFLYKNRYILGIFFIALLIRLIGITHGFPFIFHPDEPSVIRSSYGFYFTNNPGHFDWPHLHFYLNFLIYAFFIKMRVLIQLLDLREFFENLFPLMWRDPLVFYFISRLFDAFLGALTIFPIYLVGKQLFNNKIGLLSAVVFSVMPHHVWTSHYALIDVPMVFWASWGFYFVTNILTSSAYKNYVLAGLFIGFSASTKYHGGLLAPAVLLAHILRIYAEKKETLFSLTSLKLLTISGLFCVAGFLLGTPYALLDFDTFTVTDNSKGALWQFTNVGGVSLGTQVKQLFSFVANGLPSDVGYSPVILFLFGLFSWTRVIKNKENADRKKLALLFIPSVFLLFYISGFEKIRSHFYLITYPFIAIISGYYLSSFYSKKGKFYKILVYGFLLVPFALSIRYTAVLAREDTRVQLYNYLESNITKDDTLLYTSNSLIPIIKKFSINNTDKIGDVKITDTYLSKNGYQGTVWVVYSLNSTELTEHLLRTQNQFIETKLDNIINNELRRGENIVIYKIKTL